MTFSDSPRDQSTVRYVQETQQGAQGSGQATQDNIQNAQANAQNAQENGQGPGTVRIPRQGRTTTKVLE